MLLRLTSSAGLLRESLADLGGQVIRTLRRDGEIKSYIDLLFLALVVLLCIAKIVTD